MSTPRGDGSHPSLLPSQRVRRVRTLNGLSLIEHSMLRYSLHELAQFLGLPYDGSRAGCHAVATWLWLQGRDHAKHA